MYAKKCLVVPIAVLAFGISACGSSSQPASTSQSASAPNTQATAHTSRNSSAVALVRQTATKIALALESSTPEDACQYYSENARAGCVSSIAMVKAIHIKPSSILPANWREALTKATITIHGNAAVMNSNKSDKKNMHFVYVDGAWFRSD